MKLAIIGGSGVYDPRILDNIREEEVVTPYGTVPVKVGGFQGREIAFLARHGSGHSVPPHRINYKANIWALKMLGVTQVIATSAVGSLNDDMPPRRLVLISQFIDFTKARDYTYHDGGPAGVVHVDYTDPYCPELRSYLVEAAKSLDLPLNPQGCYVCTEGPRYETPAEIRMFKTLGGDLVGMTSVPEVVLAREAELCYASIALVTNWAAGIATNKLTHQEVIEVMDKNTENLRSLLMKAMRTIPEERDCECQHALHELGSLGK